MTTATQTPRRRTAPPVASVRRRTTTCVLAGGAPAWARAGHTLFKGVNLLSKTFCEIAEHAFEVPHIDAHELAQRQRRGAPLVVLDGRTLEQHRKITLPGAIPVPNGELPLRWRVLAPDPATSYLRPSKRPLWLLTSSGSSWA